MERDKYTSIIHEELNKLGLEFARYKERWDKLARSIQTVNKDVESVSITTDKISKKFDSINRVEVGKLEDYNSKEVNLLLKKVNQVVYSKLLQLEEGEIDHFDL